MTEKLYRLEQTTESGNVYISEWICTKEEMKKRISLYKRQDKKGSADGKIHRTKYRMVEVE